MTTVITRPAPAKAIEVRELVFKPQGRDFWTVDEDCPHLAVEVLYAENAHCPWCGHNPGRIEVPLHPATGAAMREVVHCNASIQSPWWHRCDRPILLVPEFDQLEEI